MADITGTSGDDTLTGTPGADRMFGSLGNDSYFVNIAADEAIELPGEGYDIVWTSASYALAAGTSVEALSAINWDATDALSLTGNEINNALYGNAGSNVLDGGGGADVLRGQRGDDFYFVDGFGDQVLESAGEGYDVVWASSSYGLTVGSAVEALSAINWDATTAINLAGNELGNALYGNAGSNLLDGGAGADVLRGQRGDDHYYVDGFGDQVIELAGEGYDVVWASSSYGLAAGTSVEALSAILWDATTAINLTGNEIANALYGNAGSNVLDGGAGADILRGQRGDDHYYVDAAGDQVIELAGEGYDIVWASASYRLTAGESVEALSAILWNATTAINLTGNEIANALYGNAGSNVLDGGAGADILRGQGGADTFAFTTALGGGNVDTIVDFGADDVILLGGNGGAPFAALASGTLRTGSFRIGTEALDADDYLIYNGIDGTLLYDADGNGAGAAVQIAMLPTALALTSSHFMVSGPANTAPVITSGATASVIENSPNSTIVYQIQANDAEGDRITYSLTGADAASFTVDANGAVRLKASPDFEAKASYNFSIIASDSGLSASKTVTLNVTNVSEGGAIINETTAPNDTQASAQGINRAALVIAANPNLADDDLPSGTILGSIATNGDKDFFSITLAAGEKLILDVDGTTGGLDSHIFVYGPNGLLIDDNDDRGSFDPGSVATIADHNTDSYYQFRAQAAGTYYFSIQSFETGSSGSYQLHVSVGPPATAEEILIETLDADADALISGAQWNHLDLTYGFPQDPNQYPDNFVEANPDEDFRPFSAAQQAAARQLLQHVANVTSLTFTELTGGTGLTTGAGSANLRYAMSVDSGVEAAHAYFPTNGGATSLGGSSWFNTTNFNNPLRGNYAWMGILHETGHALGLKHGHEDPAVSSDHDSIEYTLMTYRSYVGDPLQGGYSNETFGYAQTLMMLDISALQKVYGPNFAINATDSVYTWSNTNGEMFINGVGQGAPGNGAGGSQNRVLLTIWDGNGNDTYDMSNYGGGVTIDLRPGHWSITSQAQLASLGDGNIARGNVANALQYQGDARSLIENAIGGAGPDSLIANTATNRLTGNGGIDTFKWMAGADGGGLGVNADVITDFLRGTDKIDLSGVDANSETSADDAFSFIGASAFHSVAGELRYQIEGSSLRIQGDIDGNGVSDFEIIMSNNSVLAAPDFIF